MKISLIATTAILALTSPVFAGDAAKGENEFKKCKACHEIVADDGTAIVKGGKTGPNLYGVVGRAAGTVEGFSYSDVMKEAGEKGLVWDEETLVKYLPDPSAFLEETSGDSAGKSKMTFKLKKGGDDVAAYLASVVPAAN
ncbi:cytochrome c family protein [Pseudorhodobacter sp.]|uniref:c-type cytochrome n=1 Tax=Pseudorhodobacter sp. TaxID=1934400 RepID=UPI00264A1015|nr:cytochrome C [Pseudorhodobacter sp.]MDN5786850.1 cytochrome C [Pseudorhodobacter sp.]